MILLILLFYSLFYLLRSSFLFHITAGFYYIHYVVAKFLALGDNIHVVNSHLIIIFFVVHIQNILILQLVTVVIDFVFDVERLVDIGVDYISSGALTHSSPILDLSLKNLHAI